MANSYVNSNIKPIEKILQVAKNPKPIKPNEWMVQCPNHQDDKASLHVTEDTSNGKILLRCHAGCDNRDIVQAWGLSMKDLFPPREHPPDMPQQANRPQTVAVYNYIDVDGNLVYQVVRQRQSNGNKGFYQRHPDGHGGWINNMNGVIPLPYQLPRLIKTLEEGHAVLIVEGEKDCDRLVKLGFTATTNHGGAGKWGENHSKYFTAGSKVVILPDNDEPGRKHARSVAGQLHSQGCQVRIIELPGLPEKGDVSDWLDAGHDKPELMKLIVEAFEKELDPDIPKGASNQNQSPDEKAWKPVITCMDAIPEEEVLWLWPGYIALRKICLIEGDPSHGKTWLTLAIASAVSQGWPLPDRETGLNTKIANREPASVIYMTAEDGLGDTIKPRLENLGADGKKIFVIEGQRQADNEAMEPVTMQDLDILRQAMHRVKPALLIIDPLQGFLGAGVDMHRANETRPVLAGILRLAEEFNCAVVIIRHLNKKSGDKAAYRGMGSIDFTATARTVLLVGKDPDDQYKRIVIPTKCNVGVEGVPVAFSLTPGYGFEWVGKTDRTAEDLLTPFINSENSNERSALEEATDLLAEALSSNPRLIKEVKKDAKAADINERTLRRAREQLGVKAYKEGDNWFWYLPVRSEDGQDGGDHSSINKTLVNMVNVAQIPNISTLEHVGQEISNGQHGQHGSNKGLAEVQGMLTNLTKQTALGGWAEVGHEIDLSSLEGGRR
ncbi:MAG: AAA family ATPase [Syntrophomonas sp.]